MLVNVSEYLNRVKESTSCQACRSLLCMFQNAKQNEPYQSCPPPYLKDVALLNGHVLQLTGLLLQTQCRATDCEIVHDFLWDQQSTLTQLHGLHLLLEAIHI